MTRSSSTTRLRLTYAYYTLLVLAAGFIGPTYGEMPLSAALALRAFALALVVIASLGRIWCSAFIGGSKESRLVTEGPYSLCRHPLYVLSFIGGVGLGVATGSLVLTGFTALVLVVLLVSSARAEDRRLSSLYGDAFRAYVTATPGWWPRWRGQAMSAGLELHPRIFWKSFLDAGSFVLLYLLIDTARMLREAGILTTIITLP